jgi:hypothetical protein
VRSISPALSSTLRWREEDVHRGWPLRQRLELLAFDARLAGVPPALLEALDRLASTARMSDIWRSHSPSTNSSKRSAPSCLGTRYQRRSVGGGGVAPVDSMRLAQYGSFLEGKGVASVCQHQADPLGKFIDREGLKQSLYPDLLGTVVMTATNPQDGHRGMDIPHPGDELRSTETRHMGISDDKVESPHFSDTPGLEAIRRFGDFVVL